MKVFERVCLAGIMLASLSCFALTEKVDGITWTYTVANGEASVGGGSLSSTAVPTSTSGAIVIPSTLGGKPVTGISKSAFRGCNELTSVTISDSVTQIEDYAFSSCSGLTSVTIPDSVMSIGEFAFSYCRGITNAAIGDGVTNIGAYAFEDCDNLANVTIGDGVTSIGEYAFLDCGRVSKVIIPRNVANIGAAAFGMSGPPLYSLSSGQTFRYSHLMSFEVANDNPYFMASSGLLLTKDGRTLVHGVNGNVIIPESVTKIGNSAFYGCNSLIGVTIPDSVIEIGASAFRYCTNLVGVNLDGVTIPNSVTSIGESAFADCSGLSSVMISGCITSIRASVFSGCKRLEAVTIPENVRSIGNSAFYGCEGLTRVTIPNDLTSIGASAFYGCKRLTSMTIPNSVTNIGSSAFSYCRGLISVALPDSTTSIGTSVFSGCTSLTSVVIPQCVCSTGMAQVFDQSRSIITNVVISGRVTSIASSAFAGCSNLTSVVIPHGVTKIGDSAFSGCSGLTEITLPFVGSKRGNSESQDAIFGYIFGTSSYVGGKSTKQYYTPSSCVICYIPSSLRHVVVTDETQLGYGAFYGCANLTNVAISVGVTNISDRVFEGCSGLSETSIPPSVKSIGRYAFSNCNGLSNVTIPDGVMSIGEEAFYGCRRLIELSISSSVTNISCNGYAHGVFYGCTNLMSLKVASDNMFYESKSGLLLTKGGERLIAGVNGNVSIPNSVTSIGRGAFGGLCNLASVIMPENMKCIEGEAFYGCSELLNVVIPDRVTSIGDYAFYDCSGLMSVMIGNSVTNIGKFTFAYCSSLTNAAIPDGVTNIEEHAFYECSELTNIVFHGNAPIIGYSALSYVGNGCCAYVRRASTGWSVNIPGEWNGIGIDYLEKIVVFDANGGEGGTNSMMDIGTNIVAPTVTRTGYTFKAWTPSVAAMVPATDVTYTAQWEINKYTVTFNANDGVGGTSGKQDYGTAIVAPTVTRTGHTFKGWSPSVATTVPANDITYTAQWEVNQYAVTFDANGGAGGISGKHDYGTAIVVPTVTRTGYTFKGWSPSVAATVPANDVTYTAQWEINKYTLTFDANGGTYGMATTIVDYGTTVGELPVPTRTNASFIGWFTAAEEGSLIDGSTVITEAMILYAQWILLEEALDGGEGVVLATSGTAPWYPILDSNAKVGDATARSCKIGDRTNTWLSATVEGAGTMAFWYKVSCEHDDDNTFTWDRLMVYTNAVEIMEWRMDGETDWTQRTLSFEGGTNTVKWVYFKDRSVSEGEDCAWVDGLVWTPSGPVDTVVSIGGKTVTVPKAWLAAHENIVWNSGEDVATALQSTAANGRLSNVECYILGLDPEDATNDFKIVSFPMKADGTPDIDNIVFDPPQAKWNVPATYKVMGAADLGGPWEDVPDGGGRGATALPLRFFKVIVELP